MDLKEKKISKIISLISGFIIIITVGGYNLYNYISKKEDVKMEETMVEEYINHEDDIDAPEIAENIPVEKEKLQDSINYGMVLEITKIGLKKGLCSIGLWCNAVSKNIQIINKSDMPDKDKGVLILAGHNGNSNVSFFNKLDKLKNNDSIYIYYQGYKYEYKLNNSYEIKKKGKAVIKRDNSKNTLILITCKKNSKDKQIVYVAYLNNKTQY